MGCRLTRTKAKAHDVSHHRHREELHFVDEYGQPVTVQVEGRRAQGHRKRQPHYTMECSVQTERRWEALRAMGLVEGEEAEEEGYSPGPYFVSPDLYPANSHMMMAPEFYQSNGYLPSLSPDQHLANSYLPSVSYSMDHLDRLDYQAPDMLPYQPNSESCLIGCCNTEGELKDFPREPGYRSPWLSDRTLGYLPLSELDSGLGCGTDSPQHQVALSEVETDAVSSLPGHSPSSPGSSSSSESLISSEPSDSGFHSVSTGEYRRLHKIQAQRHAHGRSGHSPREQRGRWDLESIPEATLMTHPGAPQQACCIVGNSTTATVQFHRAERSPTLPHHHSPLSPSKGCRTEPCQRRALWLDQQQQRGGGTIETPGRSRTMIDLSNGRRQRRASHPNTNEPNTLKNSLADSRPRSSGASDWRGFQTLGNRTSNPKGSPCSLSSTLAAPPLSPRSPPSPRSKQANQKSVRNQMLRARASRLARERSEVTTDEEVREGGEEVGEEGEEGRWAGRYWSRTERRRHLALSRQHRERRGGVVGGEEQAGGGQGSSSQTVLELSHRKQNRLRNSKLLDDWTTVEELLTHGTRMETNDNQLCPSPLLSVTTV
ncbi:uncharacterized protein ACN63O_003561 [Diretmus argenteus]